MARRPLRLRRRCSHRRQLWLGALVIAIFGLRALIPTGYMLAPIDGHARLVICPSGVHDHAPGMGGMEHAAGMHHGGHASAGAEHCPFALAGGAGLLAAHLGPVEPYYSILQPAPIPVGDSVAAAPPLRYHAPRGPPSLA